jgi:hypothetical protein
MIKRTKVVYLMIIHLIVSILTLIYFNGTGDAGDSVLHYLFAHYAPSHPALFFDHWAKPLFVLIASPFAQLGFLGVKIMNVILVQFTLYFTYRTSEELHIKRPEFSQLLLIFAPLYFILTFSGLTEPLFAFLLILSAFLYIKEYRFWSLLIISFLPFVRSEGLFFLGIFGFLEVYHGRLKNLVWLGIGTVFYSLAGFFAHGDLLWTLTKIPYGKLSSTYGSGTALHFVEQLLYVTGIPFYILFWVGSLKLTIDMLQKRFAFNLWILLIGSVFSFIIAHSIFWYYGIFNSMGLKRVLICILPFVAIIATYGFNFLVDSLSKRTLWVGRSLAILFILYVVFFPFTSNPAAINFKKDLSLHTDQINAKKVANYIQGEIPHQRIITGFPYFCELLNYDCFDPKQKQAIDQEHIDHASIGDLIIWDDWFAVVEHGISLESLENNPKLEEVFRSELDDQSGKPSVIVVFQIGGEN